MFCQFLQCHECGAVHSHSFEQCEECGAEPVESKNYFLEGVGLFLVWLFFMGLYFLGRMIVAGWMP